MDRDNRSRRITGRDSLQPERFAACRMQTPLSARAREQTIAIRKIISTRK
ncbi:hypothetical protein [Ralstonia solanacearum]|nr:hypothetical protein [Ralstonia solanacearum]